jgi:membrane protein DedA with SNARE-associated domain
MTDFIVDPLVDFCVDVIGEIGYLGIFLLMLVESANVPMPSEATMLFAGFKVDDGDLTLFGIVAAGVLGNVVGSWAGYAIGYYGREELLERHKVFHVSPRPMKRVEGWFERYGAVTVFFTRMLPIVRTFISTPAGAAHMPFWRFTLYTAAGCIPWVLMLGFVGVKVGENWEDVRDKLHYLDYAVIAAIIGLVIYLLIRRRRGEPRGEAEPATEA